MFVNYIEEPFPQSFSMQSILRLAKNNYFEAAHYFKSELTSEFDQFCQEFHHQKQIRTVSVSLQILQQLEFILKQTRTILTQKFNHQNLSHPHNQYGFLRKVWTQHNKRYQYQVSLEDKFDTLNQTISMIKMRTRKLTGQLLQRNNAIWNQQIEQSMEDNVWDHPFFEKMNKKLSNISLKNEEISSKLSSMVQQNNEYARKNKQLESKLMNYKQKNKKVEKQMFELAKKKAELQKQLIQKKYQPSSSTKLRENKIGNKQNLENTYNKQSEYILLMKEDEQKVIKKPTAEIPSQNLTIRQKYRHAKNVSRKSVAYVSPNSSIDSIKNIRFERTSAKKLLIKGQ